MFLGFKAQLELLSLNYKLWLTDNNYGCSLGNLVEDEDVCHFVQLKKVQELLVLLLSAKEGLEQYLTGRDCVALGSYLGAEWG